MKFKIEEGHGTFGASYYVVDEKIKEERGSEKWAPQVVSYVG